ncbi:MAG: hypothetical protein JWM19_4364 [Actinomycetia bacterium]|nr:hypothetical protein [Actinomycetes bacterium]
MAIAEPSARMPEAATSAGATRLWLPYPEALPSQRSELTVAARTLFSPAGVLAAFGAPEARAELRAQLTARQPDPDPYSFARHAPAMRPGGRSAGHRPLSLQAQAEQEEHDRYFEVGRTGGDAAQGFSAGLVLAYLSAYENCLSMGVTLLDDREWRRLFGGLATLLEVAGGSVVHGGTGMPAVALPAPLEPAGWRDAYDPPVRWLVGHQLFFALIQGAIVGLNCFAQAAAVEAIPEADEGLALAAVFMRSSSAAMKFASDFAPGDYETTVRPAMVPPKVREGFSGLQTRDHAYLVRIFGAVRPALATLAGRSEAPGEFVESVVSAYAAHEYICARFRGDVLPSLRMAAASRDRTDRTGVEVIREMMRARLALIGTHAVPSSVAMGSTGGSGNE